MKDKTTSLHNVISIIALPLHGVLTYILILPYGLYFKTNIVLREFVWRKRKISCKNSLFANPPPTTIPIDDIEIMRALVLSDLCGHNIFNKFRRREQNFLDSVFSPYLKWVNNYTLMLYIIIFVILLEQINFAPISNTWLKDTIYLISILMIPLFLSLNLDCIRLALRIKWRDEFYILRMPLGLINFCTITLYVIFQHWSQYMMSIAILEYNIDARAMIINNCFIILGLIFTLGLSTNYFKEKVHYIRLNY